MQDKFFAVTFTCCNIYIKKSQFGQRGGVAFNFFNKQDKSSREADAYIYPSEITDLYPVVSCPTTFPPKLFTGTFQNPAEGDTV